MQRERYRARLVVFGVALVLIMGGLVLGQAGRAGAVTGITCDTETATLCTISTAKDFTIAAGGSATVDVDKDLLITGTGSINVLVSNSGAVRTLNLNVTGDLTIESGGKITGDATVNTYKGATINISVTEDVDIQSGAQITAMTYGHCNGGHGGIINISAGYDIYVGPGALISVSGGVGQFTSCPAGDITLSAPGGDIVIDGTVEAAVPQGLTGNGRDEDGGPITLNAGCGLQVNGLVSSLGQDNGADRVHLAGGCSVSVSGVVRSIGKGHISDGLNVCHGPSRPDKPASANMCVEIWSGGSVNITGVVSASGQVPPGVSWVDIFAGGNIFISGGASCAVQANEGAANTNQGGTITVKSVGGAVTMTGSALQANASSAGSDGGPVTVEAAGGVFLDGATVESLGGANGGAIAMTAYQGDLSWASGSGNAQQSPTGSITLSACTALTTGATLNPAPTTTMPNACAGAPSLPTYVSLPGCNCVPEEGRIIVQKVTNPGGEQGPFTFDPSWGAPDFTFDLGNGQSASTGWTLEPGKYSVAETALPPGWLLASAVCDQDETIGDIDVAAGETVTCTFTNVIPAQLTIVKQTDPDAAPDLFGFTTTNLGGATFNLGDGGSTVFANLVPGTYGAAETTLPVDWVFMEASCVDDGTGGAVTNSAVGAAVEVTLAGGQHVTCTFSNYDTGQEDPEPTLIIIKDAIPADNTVFWFDGGSLPNFSLQDPANTTKSFVGLTPGEYTITELTTGLDATWLLDDIDCDAVDWEVVGRAVTVDLGEGEVAVCTFYNVEELPPTGAPGWALPLGAGGGAAMLGGLLLLLLWRRRRATAS